MTTPCTCNPVAVRSHLERQEGATLAHEVNAAGEWHGVLVGETFHRVTLLVPSQAYRDHMAAIAASEVEPARTRIADATALNTTDTLNSLLAVLRAREVID